MEKLAVPMTLDDAFDWPEGSTQPPDNMRERLKFIETIPPDYKTIFLNHMMLRLTTAGVTHDRVTEPRLRAVFEHARERIETGNTEFWLAACNLKRTPATIDEFLESEDFMGNQIEVCS